MSRDPGPARLPAGRSGFGLAIAAVLVLLFGIAHPSPAFGQDDPDLVDRPISTVEIVGLERVDEQLVRNNIRANVGDPYAPAVVREDVARLYRLGRFRHVTAEAERRPDGTVRLIYTVEEQPIIVDIQVVGNTLIPDRELLAAVPLVRGGPRDDYLIQNARRAMRDLYLDRGHYLASIDVDEEELEESGILIFRVIEGPRVRVRAIEFEGNEAFTDRQLHAQIESRTAIFILRRGELDVDRLVDDVAAIDRYYRERGYLEVRVDRHIELSPDNREAKVTFLIVEGPRYTVRSVRVERMEDGRPLEMFAPEQIVALIDIRPGDVYREDLLRRSREAIRDAYGRLGHINVRVETTPLRVGEEPEIDLIFEIREGERAKVGLVHVQGNFITRDKVIRRQVRLDPGRPIDGTEIERSRRRLMDTRLFNDVRITVQDPDPADPDYRDVLVEIRERQTGSVGFGLAVGSDAGLFGELTLQQDNFDIADFPASLEEFLRGRAFRGAGQRFNMTLRPGNEIFQYAVSLTEPHLLDTEYSLRVGGSFRQRRFRQYDEERISGSLRLGRQLGDVWSLSFSGRGERVELSNIEPFAPTEVFLDEGPDVITGLRVGLTRTTIETITRPGRGSRFEIGFERVGAMGGDHDFNVLGGEYTTFLTLAEDFLGRKHTLRLNSEFGYIFGGRAPTYERFFRGGRSFRGFRFREISPKGIRADTGELGNDPVGGTWMFFAGTQYEFPLVGDAITGVFFLDSGTVTDSVGFDDYRVSIGTGLRLYIPQFGPVPIAFDFGFPLLKEPTDRTQVLSFSADIPF